jgi:hypothetical protein
VTLLGISIQMDLDSNDVAERTGDERITTVLHQSNAAVNTIQARGVGDSPVVIPAVSDL